MANATELDNDAANFTDIFDVGTLQESSQAWRYITIAVYLSIQFLGLSGNTLVLVVMWKYQRMRSVTNFLLANLAVADLCIGVFCTCQKLLLAERWVFGSGPVGVGMCKAYGAMRVTAYTASINILLLIALERFLAIVHPFSSRILLLSRSALRSAVMAAWVLGIVVSIPDMLAYEVNESPLLLMHENGTVETSNTQTTCMRNWGFPINWAVYETASFFLWFLLPVVVLATLYTAVGRRLWRSASGDLGVGDSERHSLSQRSYGVISGSLQQKKPKGHSVIGNFQLEMAPFKINLNRSIMSTGESDYRQPRLSLVRSRKRVVRVLIIVVALFVVCWLPVHIRKVIVFNFNGEAGEFAWMGTILLPLTDWLININSAVNPIVYALFSKSFRRNAWEVLNCETKKGFERLMLL